MKAKFLCLFLLIVFVNHQAVAENVLEKIGVLDFVNQVGDFVEKIITGGGISKRKIGAWNFVTTVDEFTDKVTLREGWSRDARINGDVFVISIQSSFNCSHSFILISNSSDDKLMSNLSKARAPKFRMRVDKNEAMLFDGVIMMYQRKGSIVPIDLYTINKALIRQMLVGKELLIDVNPNNSRNINPMVAKFNLNGFSEIYSKMCKK